MAMNVYGGRLIICRRCKRATYCAMTGLCTHCTQRMQNPKNKAFRQAGYLSRRLNRKAKKEKLNG